MHFDIKGYETRSEKHECNKMYFLNAYKFQILVNICRNAQGMSMYISNKILKNYYFQFSMNKEKRVLLKIEKFSAVFSVS